MRKSLCSFRLTALCDIIADMRADSPSYLAQPTGDGCDRAFSDAAVSSLAAKEVYPIALCRVLAITMCLAGTPRPTLPQA